MQLSPVKKLVIAGGGTAGWMAAAAISRKFGELLDITLIESDDIGTVGVGEATIPPIRVFHKLLGIDEQEFMRATLATFKVGISFENWGQQGDRYIHSFGKTGKETWLGDFHHFWLRSRELGMDFEFGDFCLEVQASLTNKFYTGPNADINYAYHLDATRYAKFLRELYEKNGGKRVEGKIVEVKQDHDTGFITGLTLASGETIDGDFFIDCSGFRGLLIEQTLRTGYEDWTHWLPCDSALAVQTESVRPAVPYTRSVAHHAGWRWQIPLQHRVGNGLVYCNGFMNDDEARTTLLQSVEGNTVTEPRPIKFRAGRRHKSWNKNCVALGLASGFIEPLESTSIHLFIMAITRLMRLFPFRGVEPALVNEYNRETHAEIEPIRDFVILHYKATERDDSAFWRYCKNMEVPETLAHRIELFKKTGHAYQAPGELFRIDSWTQVMLGQRIMPEQYHHIAHLMSENELRQFFTKMKTVIRSEAEKLPLHDDFVQQYCKASV
ncbi:tryptophan halogenase family protein [Cellvibrio sp. OA-2007]|uniref:tryptophan halogenase family protein n=1 Tax=Cellvibrio sp. OA-2007 TaxID=529823 RepID=UPI000A0040F2|nr:tryptophan halogenase family protein [Cellvibrio sp. OA-2007]